MRRFIPGVLLFGFLAAAAWLISPARAGGQAAASTSGTVRAADGGVLGGASRRAARDGPPAWRGKEDTFQIDLFRRKTRAAVPAASIVSVAGSGAKPPPSETRPSL